MDKEREKKVQAVSIFRAALDAVDPYVSVVRHGDSVEAFLKDKALNSLFLLGFGKASYGMARAVADQVGDRITRGVVITKYGHITGGPLPERIEVFEAGHPIPDENGMTATRHAMEMLQGADGKSLVLCLISGGGSAILTCPSPGVTLQDSRQVTDLLLKAGADIGDLNTVRKHISQVKGGRLAESAYPAHLLSLILSDVIGDRLDVIASGPTAPDRTTYGDALSVLRKYQLTDKVPRAVLDILGEGNGGGLPETPKEGDSIFEKVENLIIAGNGKAAEAARARAEELGFDAVVTSCTLQGDARETGRTLARQALARQQEMAGGGGDRCCLVSGGETTVIVKGQGKGGRNMELALVFAMEIAGTPGITLLSAGTDGTDGPTDAAGAVVDGETIARALSAGLDAGTYLDNNDSYNFFKAIDGLFVTGPTGTNVMDLQIMLIGPPPTLPVKP
jgi:glycerate 2-kinase